MCAEVCVAVFVAVCVAVCVAIRGQAVFICVWQPHSNVWHDARTCVTWPIRTFAMTHSHVWYASFICVTWFIYKRVTAHAYVWHDSFICVTWLIHSHVTHMNDSFTYVTWLIHVCVTVHAYAWYYLYIVYHIWISHITSLRYTGWRRLIGSPKLQVIFRKRATKYRSLLRKMNYKDKGSYGSSPPCIIDTWCRQMCILFLFGATTVQ